MIATNRMGTYKAPRDAVVRAACGDFAPPLRQTMMRALALLGAGLGGFGLGSMAALNEDTP